MNEWWTTMRPGRRAALVGAIVALPLVAAIVALAFRPWVPVLDMAMTELRVRDVGTRHTPLIGLPGRIGEFPDQGSHPGPLSFWLLTVPYRLVGASAWGLELGSVLVNAAALVTLAVLAARRGGLRMVLAFGLLGALAVRGYGLSVLTHPWNPYFPLLLWLVILVATWSVLCNDHRVLTVLVVAASVAAQTHVPYLLLAVSMCVVAFADVLWRQRSEARGSLLVAVGVGAVLWLPALVDQAIRNPGNIRMLLDHFATPSEDPIGVRGGLRVFFQHLDAPRALVGMVTRSNSFVSQSSAADGSVWVGAAVLVVWAGAALAAWRWGHRDLTRLHVVVGVALLVGAFSMVRIFGKVWFYLTLWAWGTLLLLLLATAWTALVGWRRRSEAVGAQRWLTGALVAGAALVTLVSIGASATLQVPEENLSAGVGLVVDATVDAVRQGVGDATGDDGSYIVFWQDAVFIGAQGYGLFNELERRGIDVGVHPTWRVPVTPHRVLPSDQVTAEIHLVTGPYIDEWRARPGYVEVIEADPRTAEEIARFDELRARVIEDLAAIGRDDLIPEVDVNLFGASLDPALPDSIRLDLSEMLLLGREVAVFIAPAGSTN